MKSILALALATLSFVAVLASAPVALAAEIREVEQIVSDLEDSYQLNIRLIPQVRNSEQIWMTDLRKLTNVMDNGAFLENGSLKSLNCAHLVCRAR